MKILSFSSDDKSGRMGKNYSLRKLLSEFYKKWWAHGGLVKLFQKTEPTSLVDHINESSDD